MHDQSGPEGRVAVSVVLFAYNQEAYIADAVKAALAQVCQPLEIILSDDASGDRTFEIMRELAQAYVGPHKVILNRNSENVGLIRHIARAVSLSTGDLIIAMSGDDVSSPIRTEALWRTWQERGKVTAVFHSKLTAMDHRGQPIPTPANIESKYGVSGKPMDHLISSASGINGATEAWTRDIFDKFGPLKELRALEDTVLAFRALLLGGEIIFVAEPLVKYRVAVSTWIDPAARDMNSDQIMRRISRLAECHRDSLIQMKRDLLAHPAEASLGGKLDQQYSYFDSVVCLAERPGILAVIRFFSRHRTGLNLRKSISVLRFAFPRAYATYWKLRFNDR